MLLNNNNRSRQIFCALIAISMVFIGYAAVPGSACCSLAPADFNNTVGWAGETVYKGKIVHVLGYQNQAFNKMIVAPSLVTLGKHVALADVDAKAAANRAAATGQAPPAKAAAPTKPTGNAMLLPIPARARMTPENFLDTSEYKDILNNMKTAVAPPARKQKSSEITRGLDIQVFSKGMYTVVLSPNATDIPKALNRVPLDKRPAINKEIFDAYAKWYPGWTFALCCFKDSITESDPMVWWYEPLNPHTLFFPALDAHTGHRPKLNENVEVNHTLIVSSYKNQAWTAHTPLSELRSVAYSKKPPKTSLLGQMLPDVVAGRTYKTSMPNGDFIFETADVRSGRCNPMRKLPPGAGESETHVPGID